MVKCKEGKPCGASCISQLRKCRKSLSADPGTNVSRAVSEVKAAQQAQMNNYMAQFMMDNFRDAAKARPSAGGEEEFDRIVKKLEKTYKGPISTPAQIKTLEQMLRFKGLLPPLPGETKPGEPSAISVSRSKDAKKFDEELPETRREGDKNFDKWGESYSNGMSYVGSGSHGSVIRSQDGTYIKRGTVSNEEAQLLNILSKNDLGPKLIAADINGKSPDESLDFVDLRRGRIAMDKVKGDRMVADQLAMTRTPPDSKTAGKNASDIYWKAMADLHRLGIAHNDAHPANLFVDETGKGRWVDLGLSQKSSKAALAEVMGIFLNINPKPTLNRTLSAEEAKEAGNWQTARYQLTGVKEAEKAYTNSETSPEQLRSTYPVMSKVFEKWHSRGLQDKLTKMGMTEQDINEMCHHGIRSTPESYTKGPWAKLSEEQAQEVINFIYQGI